MATTIEKVQLNPKRKRASLLAEKLRAGYAAREKTRCRRIGPGKISAPIQYQVTAIEQAATNRVNGLLISTSRNRLIEELIEQLTGQLSESQALAVKFARNNDWLLVYLPSGELPDIIGAIRLRAIDANNGVLLLPCDLAFTPKISDRDLAMLLLQDHQFGFLQIDCGELRFSTVATSAFLTLAELISASFPVAEQHMSVTNVVDAWSDYSARLTAFTSPPLPDIRSIVRLGESINGNGEANGQGADLAIGGVGIAGALNWWQKLKSWLNGKSNRLRSQELQAQTGQAKLAKNSATKSVPTESSPGLAQRLRNLWRKLISTDSTALRQQGRYDIRLDGGTPPPPSLFSRIRDKIAAELSLGLLQRMPWLARMVLSRHSEHLIRMLEMFNQGKLEDAFRNAIPLGDELEEKSTTPKRIGFGLPKPRRDLEFRLLELFARRGGGNISPVGPNSYQLLKQQYEAGAQKFLEQENYRAAAYVYGHLLRNYQRAAQALAIGGYHREAAVLYLEKLQNPSAAAQELAADGDYQRAAEVAMMAQEYKLAVRYYRAIDNEQGARDCIEKWIADLLAKGKFEEALNLIETELKDLRRAAKLLLEVYPTKLTESRIKIGLRTARLWLQLDARDELFTMIRRLRRDLQDTQLMGSSGSGPACSALLVFGQGLIQLDGLAQRSGVETLNLKREGWRAVAEAVGGFARAGYQVQTKRAQEVLKELAPELSDPLLIADLERACAQLQVYTVPAVEVYRERETPVMPKSGGAVATVLRISAQDIILIGRGDGSIECRFEEVKSRVSALARSIGPYRYSATAIATNLEYTRIAALGIDGVVTLWSERGDLLIDFRDPASPYTALCPSIVNGQLFVGSAKGTVSVIDIVTGRIVAQAEQEGIVSTIAYDFQYKLLACAGRSEHIFIYSAQPGREELLKSLRNISAGFVGVRSLVFKHNSTNQPTIAFGSERGDLVVAEMQNASALGTIMRYQLPGHEHWINTIAFSPDGLLASAGYDRKIRLWPNFATAPVILSGHNNEIIGLAFTSTGTLYSADTRGVVACWNVKERRLIRVFELTS